MPSGSGGGVRVGVGKEHTQREIWQIPDHSGVQTAELPGGQDKAVEDQNRQGVWVADGVKKVVMVADRSGVTSAGTRPVAGGSAEAPEAWPLVSPPQHKAEPFASSAQLV